MPISRDDPYYAHKVAIELAKLSWQIRDSQVKVVNFDSESSDDQTITISVTFKNNEDYNWNL